MYEEYRQVARRMGLELSPSDPGMMTFQIFATGTVDGRKVQLFRQCGRGAYVKITSTFDMPYDLGLGVGPEGVLSSIAELLGAHDIELGDDAFDRAFMVRGDEPERVKALLGPDARNAIAGARASGDLRVTDADFSITFGVAFGGEHESIGVLEHYLRQAALVTRVVDAGAANVPPATALRPHYDAFMAFAGPHGMGVRASPLVLEGRVGRTFVTARASRRDAGSFGLSISVGAEQSLEAGLSVRPRRTGLSSLVGAMSEEKTPTGDAAFDEKLDAHARTPEHLRAALDDAIRPRLVELAALGEVFFDDRVLSLQAAASAIAPGSFAAVVETMRAVVEARFSATKAYR